MHTTSKAQIVKANTQIHTTSRTTSIRKNFCVANCQEWKGNLQKGKKIFASHISDHNFWITVDPWATQVWIVMVQFYTDFFSIVNTTVLHNPRFVDCIDGEMKIRRAINKLCIDFWLCRGLESPTPTLFKGQLYIRNSFNSIAKRIQLDLKKEDLPTPFTLPSPKVPSKPTSLLFLLWYSLFLFLLFS